MRIKAANRTEMHFDPELDRALQSNQHWQAMRKAAEGWIPISSNLLIGLKPLLPPECIEARFKDPTIFYWQSPIPGIPAKELLKLAIFETDRRIPKIRDKTTRRMRTATRFEAMCLYLQMDPVELQGRIALCRLR